jgi:class 3 adenylate cyclase
MEANLSRLRRTIDDANITADRRSKTMARGAQSIAKLQPLQKAQFEESTINDTLHRVSASQLAELPILAFPLERSVSSLESLVANMDQRLRSRMSGRIKELRSFINGSNSILRARERELEIITKARLVLDGNADLSRNLTDVVDRLVAGANEDIEVANRDALAVQQWSTAVLLAVVGLSLLSSVLIVWLYVGRNLIARLTALSVCMESVAGGDLKVDLPDGRADDEIGRMTRALTVFRDTAVEIEESNLREIGQARQRLLDAIESISEGFCYYDSDDRLVVANSHYRSLMYPGAEATVVEGMTFEVVIRNAAERGFVKDAENRVDEWVAERLAQHRQPGTPNIQQRGEGQWIMVSERRTGDRGTVAIYSDITELKQREEELAEKSSSMEQLSNQISKYLSPQVYESIFTGKREVKVASHRRKLSIFFSDIAGFTETADQLESEDLTKLLNHYLTEMSDIATEYGATIDKYVGDAIVIFFGDPETKGVKEDALACVKMAIAMRERLTELQGIWRDSGISKPLQCRIGINTGFCTVGNFGSEARMDYTIIGSGVNLASRLEGAATPGEILVSHETYALVKDEILCDSAGMIELKGISHPVETYRVVNLYTNLQRDREVIREDLPYFNLEIDLNKLSANDYGQAVVALRRALEKLSRAEEDEVRNAL